MRPRTAANRPKAPNTPPAPEEKAGARPNVGLPPTVTVKQLADLLQTTPVAIIKQLIRHGVMASINQVINYNAAAAVATELGIDVKEETRVSAKLAGKRHAVVEEDAALLKPRPPVVTIMGHVDHGKTSLLDAIRQTKVTEGEAGGITQHIGAYQVEVKGQKITFLDTPGHEAFTAMRARGARVTDIAVLVVAADDGVMPQTVEAINHARAAGVTMVVALNKMDKEGANPDRVKKQLGDQGLVLEEWGGDVICVPVSAKKKEGLSDLLENILVVAELADLKANPNRRAQGVVIEAKLDNTRGPLATVLIQTGTLRLGDVVVAGNTWGRVRAMFDYQGKHLRRADPSIPAEIMGLGGVPLAGDLFSVVADDRAARAIVEQRQSERQTIAGRSALRLENLSAQIKAGEAKELNIILKTDVQGSVEPIRDSLERLSTEAVTVRVIHSSSGNITESDVMLAIASRGIVIGFNTRPDVGARRLADQEKVDIRSYEVIYALVEDVQKAAAGMLEPEEVEVTEGRAEVRAVFSIGKQTKIAGVIVVEGKVSRGSLARVLRQGKVVFDGSVNSLKHLKEDVREMATGFECGIGIGGFTDPQVGDIIETYRREKGSKAR
ncbi:MAG: translation initiation factor IF-2 [Chloroflexota bacterium]|nr:translation initiation factor IF-2 [Chloroflexota bacterium]